MKPTDDAARDDSAEEPRGIDGLMRRYSRWRLQRLARIADESLTALTLRNLYLSACVLLDGVFLPWAVIILEGGFSFLLFAVLLVPTLLVEAILYRRMTAPLRRRV